MNEIIEAENRGRAEGVAAALQAAFAVIKTGEFDWRDIVDAMRAVGPEDADPRQWLPIKTAPQDGTLIMVTDGERIWVSSQVVGKFAGPPKNRMPTTGRHFNQPMDCKYPLGWMRLPSPKMR